MVGPYVLLLRALSDGDIAVRLAVITFLNTFINATTSLDDRVAVSGSIWLPAICPFPTSLLDNFYPPSCIQIRHYLLAQDVTRLCEKITKDFDVEEAAACYQESLDSSLIGSMAATHASTLRGGVPSLAVTHSTLASEAGSSRLSLDRQSISSIK